MKFSVFTKLFLVYTIFTLLPVLLVMSLVVLNYEQEFDNLFLSKDKFVFSEILSTLYVFLTDLKLQIIIAIVLIVLLSLFGLAFLTRMIVGPLKKLSQGVRELKKENFEIRLNIKSKDEFGELADHFNKTAAYLKESRLAIQKTKDFFEEQVTQRTRELKDSIQNREETIQERTKQLQERVDELETIHRLAANRELKMIELKEEIAKLKNKLEPSSKKRQNK